MQVFVWQILARNNIVKRLDEVGIEASAYARNFSLQLCLYVMHFPAILSYYSGMTAYICRWQLQFFS